MERKKLSHNALSEMRQLNNLSMEPACSESTEEDSERPEWLQDTLKAIETQHPESFHSKSGQVRIMGTERKRLPLYEIETGESAPVYVDPVTKEPRSDKHQYIDHDAGHVAHDPSVDLLAPTPVVRRRLRSLYQIWHERNNVVTTEVTDIFRENLAIGLPVAHICALAHIDFSTYQRFMKEGQDYFKAFGSAAGATNMYARFYLMVTELHAQWIKKKVKALDSDLYDPNWVRDSTMLERRDRANFGRADTASNRYGNADPDMQYL